MNNIGGYITVDCTNLTGADTTIKVPGLYNELSKANKIVYLTHLSLRVTNASGTVVVMTGCAVSNYIGTDNYQFILECNIYYAKSTMSSTTTASTSALFRVDSNDVIYRIK